MEQLQQFMESVAQLPDLVSLIVCPALLVLAGILLVPLGGKRAYLPTAIGVGGAGVFLVACELQAANGNMLFLAAYVGLYALLAVLVSLLFCIPISHKGKEKSAEEELYAKFRLPLEETAEEEAPLREVYAAEECGVRLHHAAELLDRLMKCDLSASDRLEADALSHTLESYRNRALTAEEFRGLNDCLATILKLTAKYKL